MHTSASAVRAPLSIRFEIEEETRVRLFDRHICSDRGSWRENLVANPLKRLWAVGEAPGRKSR